MSIPTDSVTAPTLKLKDYLAFQQFPWQNGLALQSGSMGKILDEWIHSQEGVSITSNINLNLLKVYISLIS
jgi:hypothetical protein